MDVGGADNLLFLLPLLRGAEAVALLLCVIMSASFPFRRDFILAGDNKLCSEGAGVSSGVQRPVSSVAGIGILEVEPVDRSDNVGVIIRFRDRRPVMGRSSDSSAELPLSFGMSPGTVNNSIVPTFMSLSSNRGTCGSCWPFRRFRRRGIGTTSLFSASSDILPSTSYRAGRMDPFLRLDNTDLNRKAFVIPCDNSRSEICLKNFTNESSFIERGSFIRISVGKYSGSIKFDVFAAIRSNGACLSLSRQASSREF